MIGQLVLVAALLVGAVVSLAGVLAPVYPAADLPNHFRPYALAATGALLLCALAMHTPRMAWASAALAGLNAILLTLPLLWSAEPAERPAAGQALAAAGHRDLKVVTFNIRYDDVRPIARFLLQEDADIVLLQEIGASEANALRPLLQTRYPHSHTCVPPHRCDAALFAKRPWIAVGQERWTSNTPEMVWAQFNDPQLGRFWVAGVHLGLPFRSEMQTRHVDELIARRGALAGPAIFAGDFNMTPWSYRMQRLLATAGLRHHAMFLRSWPTDRQYRLPLPAFLIDHVITTPDIRTVSVSTGPNLGSDHLPVIAVLRLPRP
jgi:endonuclease/exonuclease/phosphatase (EEP) superfamily protein YafD